MSNPIAYPILRTPDPVLALHMARQLVAVGDRQYGEVSVGVELCSVPEVLRIREALPDAWFRKWDVRAPNPFAHGVHASELSSDADFLALHLPLWASMEDRPLGSVEEDFAALVGPNIGEILWSSLIWPDVPARDIRHEADNALVSLLFNCRTQDLDERSDDHTVLVHVRRRNRDGSEERHASWLAEQIGLSVIGPPQE
ncbi:hypothetical protein [Streptomyces sp. NPDC048350]|uniref:hypothetical protein n=1 Tax=Streptomyces sp. NPDC048350 TaxID=3365538 RepID=UPI00371E9B14